MGLRDFLRRAFAASQPADEAEQTGGQSGPGETAEGHTPARRAQDPADPRSRIRLRLVAVDALPTVEGLPHLRAIAPGVVEVLTLDLADRIVVPPTTQLAPWGSTAELIALGRANLRRLIGEGLQRREIRAEDGLRFCFAHGPDYSTSSLALVLPEVLAYLEPGTDIRRGVAVSIPDRHHLAYRTIDGLESVMALGPMAAFARNGYDGGDGPLSPEVFWARGPRLDQWEQLTRQSPEGIEIHVPAALTALVEEE